MPSPTTATSHTVTFPADPGEEPTIVTATVERVERREENGVYGPMVGLDAQLKVLFPGAEAPESYFLSRLVDETWWVQDAHIGSSGFPDFSHGFGARYLRLKGIAAELEVLLDQVARDLGLVTAIGPDVPLVLAAPAVEPADDDGQDPA